MPFKCVYVIMLLYVDILIFGGDTVGKITERDKETVVIPSFYKFLSIFILIIMFLIGFFVGRNKSNQNDSVRMSSVFVYIDGEQQIFRDSEGHRLSVIEYDNNLYIPYTDKGLYMGRSSELLNGNLYLKNSDLDTSNGLVINTITVDGVPFSNDDIVNNKYTLFLNWATWCPDCKELLNQLALYQTELIENNIVVIGVPYFDSLRSTFELSKEIKKIQFDVGIEFENIICNKYLSEYFQTNLSNIPSIVVLDNKGRLVINEKAENISVLSLINIVKEYSSCNHC